MPFVCFTYIKYTLTFICNALVVFINFISVFLYGDTITANVASECSAVILLDIK